MSDCILWDGATNQKGYGVDSYGVLAHRSAYRMKFGDIPANYHVHHKCGTPACVNPDHLEALSPLEHNREHVSGPALGGLAEDLLALWGPMRIAWIAHWLDEPHDHVAMALRRSAKCGRVEKLSRGIYQCILPDREKPSCPICHELWQELEQWCDYCGDPKWTLLGLQRAT